MNNYDKSLIAVAKVCHDTNRSFCQTLGDFSQPTWEEAPAWQQESCLDGVRFHLKKPRTVDESHLNWMAHKISDGWKYGPVKDPEKKEHPCLVPFDELPYEQQFKDALFMSVVLALSPLVVDAAGRDMLQRMKDGASA